MPVRCEGAACRLACSRAVLARVLQRARAADPCATPHVHLLLAARAPLLRRALCFANPRRRALRARLLPLLLHRRRLDVAARRRLADGCTVIALHASPVSAVGRLRTGGFEANSCRPSSIPRHTTPLTTPTSRATMPSSCHGIRTPAPATA
eukprot:scaffold151671_cov37-Tisochrysis_lutea.AAC.2